MINDKAVNSSCLSSFPFGEVGRGFFQANFHRLHHFLSALSQAIPPYFERNTEPLPSLPSEEGLTNSSLITSFDLIMNVELGFLQARSAVVYL